MKVEELRSELDRIGVPKYQYSLLNGGFPNEAHCLIRHSETDWECYYSCHGEKWSIRHFNDEEEACTYLYRNLKKYAKKLE